MERGCIADRHREIHPGARHPRGSSTGLDSLHFLEPDGPELLLYRILQLLAGLSAGGPLPIVAQEEQAGAALDRDRGDGLRVEVAEPDRLQPARRAAALPAVQPRLRPRPGGGAADYPVSAVPGGDRPDAAPPQVELDGRADDGAGAGLDHR